MSKKETKPAPATSNETSAPSAPTAVVGGAPRPPAQTAEQRYSYVKYDGEATNKSEAFKKSFVELTRQIESNTKPGRAQANVLTRLEEAFMWVGKALRDEQIERNGSAEELPERSNG